MALTVRIDEEIMNRNRFHETAALPGDPALPDPSEASSEPAAPGNPTHTDQPAENPLVWREEWCLGVPALDADHRKLMNLVNHLLAIQPESASDLPRVKRGGDPGATDSLARFDALLHHLRHHFKREEALMQSIEYEDFQTHTCEHSLQLAELTELRRQLIQDGQSELSREALQWVKRWCFDHFIAEDRRFAEAYLESARPSVD
jgi:hemerythrin